ncbi:4-(cytidine 5'-diphospho)-2-C-methyl-D-erythritol kinase [Piscinibacter sp.]|jgi:4-diphosphocytidyl-2-C-methyl-D-erythritol kinase|uniref:4-(cytidine 5'-diphospho)-2-C-methyl-D-erythritol kinase n=1 Tax=Piscinibacter sp. TaxID=1903157 RepID=UPI003559C032
MSVIALYDVPAPAKLNLFLHVIGRRPDGYHLLQSVFVLIDWCDTLHFERRSDARLARHDLGAALPEDDLCLRAARALQSASGTSLGADISIAKQVPWGAGMGGGSSDAASTLLALNRLWALDWPLSRLLPLGLKLGADVPFFLAGHNAFVEGIGEQLTPLALPPLALAVIKPAASIETRAIFESPLLARNTGAVILAGLLADVGVSGIAEGFGSNDLQRAAEAQCDEVAQVAQCLQARFGNSRMTGSGSAVFARAGLLDGTDSQPMATMPPDLPAGWVGRMCRSLEQHPLAGWASS